MENCSKTVLTAVFVSIEVALLTEMKLYSSSRRSVELAVKTLTRKLTGTLKSLNFKIAEVRLAGVEFVGIVFEIKYFHVNLRRSVETCQELYLCLSRK